MSFHVSVGHFYIFFGKCLSNSSVYFLIRLLLLYLCYWVVWDPYTFWIFTAYQMQSLQIFSSPVPQIAFSFWGSFLLLCRRLSIWCNHSCLFCFCCLCFWSHIHKIIANTNVKRHFLMFLSRIFMVSGLTCKFLTYFELIWVVSVRHPFIIWHINT